MLHTALSESAFTTAVLRSPADWEAVGDFLAQVPLKKLAFLFLTRSAAHICLLLLLLLNGTLLLGWMMQGLIFSWSVTASELRVAREQTLSFAVFRVIFLGSILETISGSIDEDSAPIAATAVAGNLPLAPGASALRELACWLCWFGLIAFLRWFLALLRERFSSAQASPYATVRTFTKYLVVTCGLTAFNVLVGATVVLLCHPHTTWTVLSLLLFENVLLMASCVKIICRYALYIQTLRKEQPWEERGSTLYYAVS